MNMKILIFTEGTILMHASAVGKTREEIVLQSKNPIKRLKDGILDYAKYIPVLSAASKIKKWKKNGAEIFYLSSRRTKDELEAIKGVLLKYGFPDRQNLLFRKQGEEYKDVAEKLVPDILVEDDCESIGGEKEMTYTHISPEIKNIIHSILVPEFGGIDHLPDDIGDLKEF